MRVQGENKRTTCDTDGHGIRKSRQQSHVEHRRQRSAFDALRDVIHFSCCQSHTLPLRKAAHQGCRSISNRACFTVPGRNDVCGGHPNGQHQSWPSCSVMIIFVRAWMASIGSTCEPDRHRIWTGVDWVVCTSASWPCIHARWACAPTLRAKVFRQRAISIVPRAAVWFVIGTGYNRSSRLSLACAGAGASSFPPTRLSISISIWIWIWISIWKSTASFASARCLPRLSRSATGTSSDCGRNSRRNTIYLASLDWPRPGEILRSAETIQFVRQCRIPPAQAVAPALAPRCLAKSSHMSTWYAIPDKTRRAARRRHAGACGRGVSRLILAPAVYL
jgi:hypothetical protein